MEKATFIPALMLKAWQTDQATTTVLIEWLKVLVSKIPTLISKNHLLSKKVS